jgi:hypothetical protein
MSALIGLGCHWCYLAQAKISSRRHNGVNWKGRMKFWQQFLLQLVSPVVGTALIGAVAAVITRRCQDRRLDRQVRMDLVSNVSEIFSTIHTRLAFYERWLRHSQPDPQVRDMRRAEVDKEYVQQRIKLGALQTQIDVYFGHTSESGALLHRLTDLAMLRYAIILELPHSQVTEMIDHLGRPGHSGYSVEELETLLKTPKEANTQIWPPTAALEESFMRALHATVRAVLATKPITSVEGFKSNKLLTAYDQRDSSELTAMPSNAMASLR